MAYAVFSNGWRRLMTPHLMWVVGRGWIPTNELRVGDQMSDYATLTHFEDLSPTPAEPVEPVSETKAAEPAPTLWERLAEL